MNWNRSVRQAHRWLSVAFTAAFLVVSISALAAETPAEWVYLVPLLPLFLLLLTGVYLFVLPYVTQRRSGRSAQ